jgi:hypothetical protein
MTQDKVSAFACFWIHIKPPTEVRSIVLKALTVLYSGRGNTQPRDGKGWYLLNRNGETGKSEIQWILSQGLLDEEGKKEFASFLTGHDFSDAQKKAAGFGLTDFARDLGCQSSRFFDWCLRFSPQSFYYGPLATGAKTRPSRKWPRIHKGARQDPGS